MKGLPPPWPLTAPVPAAMSAIADTSTSRFITQPPSVLRGGKLSRDYTVSLVSGVGKMFTKKSLTVPSSADALPGRTERMAVPEAHFVNGHRLSPPFPDGLQQAMFGMGCFWGAEP